jgi:hypothetical protein
MRRSRKKRLEIEEKGFFKWLKDRAKKKLERLKTSLRVHSTVFLAVNLFLTSLNIFVAPGFPWAFFPAAGWGIGLACHYQALRNRKDYNKLLFSYNNLTEDQARLLWKLQFRKSAFRMHTAAYLAVNGFLLGINLITTGLTVPWFLFPLSGWGIGYFSHLSVYRGKKIDINERLMELKNRKVSLESEKEKPYKPLPESAENTVYLKEAEDIVDSLIIKIKKDENLKNHYGAELEKLLNDYYSQIKILFGKHHEVENTLSSVSGKQIENDISATKKKLDKTENDMLIKEYNSAIKQYEHQLKSIKELENHKEIIELRIKSSLTSLKQLELDSARLKHLSDMEEPESLRTIKQKSGELSDYLKDFKKSYKELSDF